MGKIRITESGLKKAIDMSVKRILREFNQDAFNASVDAMVAGEELGKQFIDFIEKYHGGVLLQTIVDYESGNETGEPMSPVPTLIGEFEDGVMNGQKLTPEQREAVKKAYNQWWYYAQDQLMPDHGLDESIKRNVRKMLNEIGGGVHPNRQMDLFMNQDEVDDYHETADDSMFGAMYNALCDCGWSISGEKEVNGGTRYTCYADNDFRAASQKEVIEKVKETSPRPQNLKFVNVRKQYAPEIKHLGIIIYDVVD